MTNRFRTILPAALLSLIASMPLCAAVAPPPATEPAQTLEIAVDKNPRIIAYQLRRLSNADLVTVIRKSDDPRYKPIYETILTRKGLDKKYRAEAAVALAKMNKTDEALEILNGIGAVDPDDKLTQRELVSLLLAQKPAGLAAQKEKLSALAKDSESNTVKQAAYAALATADGKPDGVWQQAAANEGGLKFLLGGIPWIKDAKLREAFYPKVAPLAAKAGDDATQAAAAEAISSIPGHDTEEFSLLGGLVNTAKGDVRNAAVRSLGRIPSAKWPKDQIEALAQDVVGVVKQIPSADRTTPAALQTVQLGEALSAALPPAQGVPIRKALRELSVRVIALHTIREQMEYDMRYFVVEAGKPVEILLENDDAMPHNIVIGAPGSLAELGMAAGAMSPPADEKEKAYIPDSPKVLASMALVQPDETGALSFTAPKTPGQYVFFCSFPGHWLKMYGTMLVVPNLEAWEAKPTVPTDPMSKKPYEKQKVESENGEGK
jgi:azurin